MATTFNPATQRTVNSAYCVDIDMCIDATGSMGHLIEEVKRNAMSFCDKFHEAMQASGKNVDQLRIKVTVFRDFGCDGADALQESRFFVLPDENEAYRDFVMGINPMGGGDEPESALEAIAKAMQNDWTRDGAKRRHVILMFTDASAVALKEATRTANPLYPANMPDDLAALGARWAGTTQEFAMPEPNFARMVVFAPNVKPWNDMEIWNNYWPAYSAAGTGLDDLDIEEAINLLVASV